MKLQAPILYPIDPEILLFGKVHLIWSDVGAPVYYIYRDYDPIKNVSGWEPYKVIEDGKTTFDDAIFKNKHVYCYAICAVSKDGSFKSPLSNTERIKIDLPTSLIVDKQQLSEAAYYESHNKSNPDDKIWQLARYCLIIENTFPERSLEYLRVQVKNLKKDLPEFNGLFFEPGESEIRGKSIDIYNKKPSKMQIDWDLSELKLIKRKIDELIEYEKKIR